MCGARGRGSNRILHREIERFVAATVVYTHTTPADGRDPFMKGFESASLHSANVGKMVSS